MFSAFKKFGKLGALASSVARAWSPLALWPDGIATPGMWISPRDLTSQWQDYTGTTPVATPGTVADSANPVGLALDIRAGAPEVLGPELVVNGDFSDGTTGWTGQNGGTCVVVDGQLQVTSVTNFFGGVFQALTLTVGKSYLLTATVRRGTAPRAEVRIDYAGQPYTESTTDEAFSIVFQAPYAINNVQLNPTASSGTAYYDNISVREIPGNHMLQSTSTSRPLLSAYDGQTLGPGDTYDSAGYPIFQLYDGVDDGMATAAFAAGTLTSGMDCMIVVRRDSGALMMMGLYEAFNGSKFTGIAESGSAIAASANCGSPTVWVDNVQLAGGTAVTRGTLYTALTVGDWHILELRNLDLSTWTALGYGYGYVSHAVNGPRGDILLYPSTASTEDKDAARQWLADYYGVTLA